MRKSSTLSCAAFTPSSVISSLRKSRITPRANPCGTAQPTGVVALVAIDEVVAAAAEQQVAAVADFSQCRPADDEVAAAASSYFFAPGSLAGE